MDTFIASAALVIVRTASISRLSARSARTHSNANASKNSDPSRYRRAIAKHSVPAAQNFLLLSNIASPQSRAALAAHPAWQLWDREDISLRIRSLPKVDQHDLVDTFFRGKRLELLGEPEPGPWMTADQFFAPYLESTRLFNHTWPLVGRTNEAAALQAAVDDNSVAVTLLVAPAGGGKTRLLRHVVGNIDVVNTGRRIWFPVSDGGSHFSTR